jgi:hypothetical protein
MRWLNAWRQGAVETRPGAYVLTVAARDDDDEQAPPIARDVVFNVFSASP